MNTHFKIAKTGAATGVIGGAIVPHAPQFLSLPKTEDADQVARVRAAMQKVGDGLRALTPDLVVVIANAHGEDFSVNCVPAFMVYCGDRANGAGPHKGRWNLEGETGIALMRQLLDSGFDPAYTLDGDLGTSFTIPLEFCGYPRDFAFLPLLVNVYCPPLPTPERCFEFGKALHRAFQVMGLRVVILASGGLSHYPATPMYPTPDLETDKGIYERLTAGNFRYLMSFDEKRLDVTGNTECRSAQILIGALGVERAPDIMQFEPSWHHIYAVLGWTKPSIGQEYAPYYPAIATEHVQLARAVYAIVTQPQLRDSYIENPKALGSQFELSADECAALAELDENVLRERFSINPIIVYWAKLAVEGKKKPTAT
jgi:2,3-dihydroxyphenylpropionate 1,2-dioxygenase